MKWSLNTYQTCQDWELDKILDISKATGYHGVEFLMDYEQKHGLEWDTPEDQWPVIKEMVDKSGLEFASLTSCQTFHTLDDDERNASVERVKRVIKMANALECPDVRVLGDRLPEDENKQTVLDNVGNCLRELGELAQPLGVNVSIEMHGSFTAPDYSLEVVQAANLPNVGVVFNCVWPDLSPGDSIEEFHNRIAPYIKNVHTHQVENDEQFDFYRQMFRLLKRDGYTGYVSNEGAYRGPDPEKVLALYVALYKALAASAE